MKTIIAILSTCLLAGGALAVQDKAKTQEIDKKQEKAQAELIAKQLPTYPFTECLVSSEPLDAMGAPLDLIHEGRLVRFCCKSCVKGFKKDPAKVLSKIDAAIVEQQAPSYPMDVCLISGESLDAMGEPMDMIVGTRLVRLCCKGCVKGFKKDPNQHIEKINAALIANQKKTYPTNCCLVSGKEIEGEGVDYLHGIQLVRFCCPKCPEAFKKDPEKYLSRLEKGAKKAKVEKTDAEKTGL